MNNSDEFVHHHTLFFDKLILDQSNTVSLDMSILLENYLKMFILFHFVFKLKVLVKCTKYTKKIFCLESNVSTDKMQNHFVEDVTLAITINIFYA